MNLARTLSSCCRLPGLFLVVALITLVQAQTDTRGPSSWNGTPPVLAKFQHTHLSSNRTASLDLATLDGETLRPMSLASGDFNGDRVADLVVGWATPSGGVLEIYPGNVVARYPNSSLGLQRRAEGISPDLPFLPEPSVLEIPVEPSFLVAGDFNLDRCADIIVAALGDRNLYWLKGDGQGGFLEPGERSLPGELTVLVAGEVYRRDERADLIVGVQTQDGPLLALYLSWNGALESDPLTLELADPATSVVTGQFDNRAPLDLAVLAGQRLQVIAGSNRTAYPRPGPVPSEDVFEHHLPVQADFLVAGDFFDDRRTELTTLSEEGELVCYQFENAGLTELYRSRLGNSHPLQALGFDQARRDSQDSLVPVRLAGTSKEILIHFGELSGPSVLLPGQQSEAGGQPEERIHRLPLEIAEHPLVILPLKLNKDALYDLVSLTPSGVVLSTTTPAFTFRVNEPGQEYDLDVGNEKCDVRDPNDGVNSCTLTAAVQEANVLCKDFTLFCAIEFDIEVVQPSRYSITAGVVIDGKSTARVEGGLSLVETLFSTVSGLTLERSIDVNRGDFNEIVNNHIIEWGIRFTDASENLVLGNTIDGRNADGVSFQYSYGSIEEMYGNRIEGNTIRNTLVNGISDNNGPGRTGSSNLTVISNTIYGNRRSGIAMGGSGGLVEDNKIAPLEETGNTRGGLYLWGGDTTVLENEFHQNGECGICVVGAYDPEEVSRATNNIFDGNTLRLNTAGILLLSFRGDSDEELCPYNPDTCPGHNNRIEHNSILENFSRGISVGYRTRGTTIEGNTIGGNLIGIWSEGQEGRIINNLIGFENETTPLGNTKSGVNAAGREDLIEGNTIAYNGTPPSDGQPGDGRGIEILGGYNSCGNRIFQNSIFDNVGADPGTPGYAPGLGIDVYGEGVTSNDGTGIQPHPELSAAGNLALVSVQSPSNPGRTFIIEFFSNDSCDPSGYGEGKTYLGSMELVADDNGSASGYFSSSPFLTATATLKDCTAADFFDDSNYPDNPCNTSEFSNCLVEGSTEPILVNSLDDEGLADGVLECDTGATPGQPVCTLRAAIEFANQFPSPDVIHFDIPTGPPWVISLNEPLPEIVHPLRIDGTQLDGEACRPTVGIDGSKIERKNGLVLKTTGSRIEGLAIHGFRYGIVLDCPEGDSECVGWHTVECNYLGIDVTGQQSLRNENGILVNSHYNQIGGITVAQRNVISNSAGLIGLGGIGVEVKGNETQIEGNFIGTDITGTKAQANDLAGVWVNTAAGAETLIGGSTGEYFFTPNYGQPPGNVISGNVDGIRTFNGKTWIEGNIIGADSTGQKRLPNGRGIRVTGSGNVFIGGPEVQEGNQISSNTTAGVEVDVDKTSELAILIGNNVIGADRYLPSSLGNKTGILHTGHPSGIFYLGIGGEGLENVIAHNQDYGVRVSEFYAGTVKFERNSIHDNGIQGISSPTLAGEHPRIGGATYRPVPYQAGLLSVIGFVTSPLLFQNRVEIYGNRRDYEGLCQGERYIGSAEVNELGFFKPKITTDLVKDYPYISALAKADPFAWVYTEQPTEFSHCMAVRVLDLYGGELEYQGKPLSVSVTGGEINSAVAGRPEVPLPYAIFPVGLPSMEISVPTPAQQSAPASYTAEGGAVTVRLEFEQIGHVDSYYNYGPTPENSEPHWYEFLYDGTTGAEIFSDHILVHLVDGLRGDHDLTVNGVIVTEGGPMVHGTELYFPYNRSAAGTFVGFGVSNFSDNETLLKFDSFSAAGFVPRGVNEFPVMPLAAQTQLAMLGDGIFAMDEPSGEVSWVQVVSSEEDVGSFFQFGTNTLSQLDGSVAQREVAQRLYFTRLFEGPTAFRGQAASTYLSIANPGAEAIDLTLTLHAPDSGSSAAQAQMLAAERTIASRGFLYESLEELFGEGLQVSEGYVEVEVTQGEGAVGMEIIQLEDPQTVLGLNAVAGNEATTMYSAQFASAPTLFTHLNLLNTSAETRVATLTAVDSDGNNVAPPVEVTLAPGEPFGEDAGLLFGASFVGSLRVETDGQGVIGDVIFGDPAGFEFAAALQLQSETYQKAIFSQVANVPGFFTGVALYNPGLAAAVVEIRVVASNGTETGHATTTLEPGQRLSELVPALVPESDGQGGGYIVITSDKPVIAQQLFGALQGGTIKLMSAVPPTIIEGGP